MTTCAHCQTEFTKQRMGQRVCSPTCARRVVAAQKAQAKERAKLDRAMDKAKREGMKTIPQLIAEADKAFQEFIRWRDRLAGHTCISSGRVLDWSGNQVDAGHYRSKGAASHLRYNEDNCHAQTKYENQHKAGNAVDYRIRLIERIGLERVIALECDNEPVKWTKEGLRQIAVVYRAKTRDLKKGQ